MDRWGRQHLKQLINRSITKSGSIKHCLLLFRGNTQYHMMYSCQKKKKKNWKLNLSLIEPLSLASNLQKIQEEKITTYMILCPYFTGQIGPVSLTDRWHFEMKTETVIGKKRLEIIIKCNMLIFLSYWLVKRCFRTKGVI